ncbi:hypothetical protein, partial [Citrobacter koseri]|uniref:hypothetical protein n=1 Tax=Citrobacter koseri TaxID=545 RepID=UPI00397D7370
GSVPAKRALNPHPCGFLRPYGNTSAIFSRTRPHLTISTVCFFNSKTGATENQSIAAMPLFRLKIDETLTADRVRPQGRGRR